MKPLLLIMSCALLAVASARAQTLDPEDAVQAFKARFDAVKTVPQAAAAPSAGAATVGAAPKLVLNCSYSKKDRWDSLELGGFANYDKKNYEALFQPSADGGSWEVAAVEPVDGKPLKLTATTSDAGAHVKASASWGGASKAQGFAPKGGKLDGYRFVVAFKAPGCIVIACGVNAEPISTAGKTCD